MEQMLLDQWRMHVVRRGEFHLHKHNRQMGSNAKDKDALKAILRKVAFTG